MLCPRHPPARECIVGVAESEVNISAIEHIPVLAKILAEQIDLPREAVMVDATIGHGGHSKLFGRTLGPEGMILGLDLDDKSIQRAQSNLKDLSCRVILVRSNFSQISEQVHNLAIKGVDFILADLGICSEQLADCEKGLSFLRDMPLDMRIDESLKRTAADIVNGTDEKSLADLIYKFGEDRASRRIARYIVERRRSRPVTTTGQLSAIVCEALGQPQKNRRMKVHPATRTFQALRIAVNHELENLEKLLGCAPGLLNKNGRIAIISYHSLEDRLVKNDFKRNEKEGIYRVVTKKPIVPTRQEISSNRRARSAKLRIAQRQ